MTRRRRIVLVITLLILALPFSVLAGPLTWIKLGLAAASTIETPSSVEWAKDQLGPWPGDIDVESNPGCSQLYGSAAGGLEGRYQSARQSFVGAPFWIRWAGELMMSPSASEAYPHSPYVDAAVSPGKSRFHR